jgi:multidrug efflux system membrane fusion protein
MSKPDAHDQGAVMLVVESDFLARPIPFSHILLVFACAMTSAILLAGCKPAPNKKLLSPAVVEVASVVPKPIRLSDEFNGRVASINSVDVRGRVTGYVDKVAYREGDSVNRGDLLSSLIRDLTVMLSTVQRQAWNERRQRRHSRIFRQKGQKR